MADPRTIRISSNPEIQVQDIGDGRRAVIVDDFLEDPESLIDYAVEHEHEFRVTPHTYPGPGRVIRAETMLDIQRFIRSRLSKHFPFHRAGIDLSGGLSIVTFKPETLSNFQRICHIDPRHAANRRTYAGLVYLFRDPQLGGTAFYRWKAKDIAIRAMEIELKDPAAANHYLTEHSEYYRQPPQYMTATNDIAELIAVIPAKFNRFVFYDGEYPHSGHITAPELLTPDFRKGRFTLNLFSSVKPREALHGVA